MQRLGKIRSFAVELAAGPAQGAYRGGELLSGQVVLELGQALQVRALEVCARGLATAHWLESRSVGMNTVYSDYTACEPYLRARRQLIRESCRSLLCEHALGVTSEACLWHPPVAAPGIYSALQGWEANRAAQEAAPGSSWEGAGACTRVGWRLTSRAPVPVEVRSGHGSQQAPISADRS